MTKARSRPILLLPVLLAAWLPLGHGQSTERYPVPVFIENSEVLSGLEIELTTRSIDLQLEAFLAEAEGGAEDVLAEFLIALLSGNMDSALQLTREDPGIDQVQTQNILKDYAGLIAAYQDRITVERETLIGRDSLMTLRIDIEQDGQARGVMRSFRFTETPEGLRYDSNQQDFLRFIINNTFQVNANQGGIPDSIGESRDHLYTIPGTEEGSPVRLQFDGRAVNFDALDPASIPADPLLARYATAWQTFVNGDPGTFASYWTDFSAGRILEWAPNASTEAWQRTRDSLQSAGRSVKFVLDADPVYFVFYHPNSPLLRTFPLLYDVMYAPADGVPVLANFFTEGYFDDVLKTPELFVDPFLRPYLAGLGLSPGPDPERAEQLALEAEVAALEAELAAEKEEEALPVAPVEDKSEPVSSTSGDDTVYWPWIIAFVVLLVLLYLRLRRGRNNQNPSP